MSPVYVQKNLPRFQPSTQSKMSSATVGILTVSLAEKVKDRLILISTYCSCLSRLTYVMSEVSLCSRCCKGNLPTETTKLYCTESKVLQNISYDIGETQRAKLFVVVGPEKWICHRNSCNILLSSKSRDSVYEVDRHLKQPFKRDRL